MSASSGNRTSIAPTAPARAAAPLIAIVLLAMLAPAESLATARGELRKLPVANARDVVANGRLFQRGLPVSDASFSPDGFHFAYLHTIPGGVFRRKPQRCAFLLDLATAGSRSAKAPKGAAVRLGGWDPTGRYLLLETVDYGLFSALTASMTTYHWIYDVVTSEFVPRRSFTGMRDGVRFRWKVKRMNHGAWGGPDGDKVWPMYDGELARIYRDHDEEMIQEVERRTAFASRLGVGSAGPPAHALDEVLFRLDEHWTQRGHRDPVVSELFGDRPELFWREDGEWVRIRDETEYVAVLDHDLALVTGQGGAQVVFCPEKWELLLLPPVPAEFIDRLETRWDRSGAFYVEDDPLPRDLQYRRSAVSGEGIARYFNYVTSDRARLLMLYVLGPEQRILRIVDLPESWALPRPVKAMRSVDGS